MNQSGIDLIKSFEGCSLVAYEDQTGRWTIGYGQTQNVKAGDVCTQDQAEEWLMGYTQVVQSLIQRHITVLLSENQISACVCLAYNIGPGRFVTSTLLQNLNLGYTSQAADQFLVWDKISGTVSDGLTRRRQAERALFLSST